MWQKLAIVGLIAAILTGCGDTRLERTLTGAGIGAAGAAAVGGDPGTGAVVGGVAGLTCEETNTCL